MAFGTVLEAEAVILIKQAVLVLKCLELFQEDNLTLLSNVNCSSVKIVSFSLVFYKGSTIDSEELFQPGNL